MSGHSSSLHIDHKAQEPASTGLAQVAVTEVAVGVEDNAPYPLMSLFVVRVVVQRTCEIDSTSLEDRDSCWDKDLRCRCTQNQVVRCYMSEATTQAVRRVVAGLEKASLARSKRRQLCKMNWNCCSRWMKTQEIQVNQPGATMYRRKSMPVAAVAEIVRAAYRSHTEVVGRRDDCSTVRLKVPGSALLISTEAPVFRLKRIKSELDDKQVGSAKFS
jgi:hypothetical protein